jgi:hypothetical protein
MFRPIPGFPMRVICSQKHLRKNLVDAAPQYPDENAQSWVRQLNFKWRSSREAARKRWERNLNQLFNAY